MVNFSDAAWARNVFVTSGAAGVRRIRRWVVFSLSGAVAAWGLAGIASQDAQVVARILPVLQKNLQHPAEQIRARSAEALGALGPAALPAAAQLQTAAQQDDRPAVCAAASAALKEISGS